MSRGGEHPFAGRAAVPGRRARGVQGCLSAHGSRHSPVRGYWQQLCQGLVRHTHTIYMCIYIYLYAYVCKLQCWGRTSQLPSAVHSVKRLAVQEPEQSRILQKSHSRSISVRFQRRSLGWPREQRRFAFTRKNQRFSHCPPLNFLHLTRCFSPAQLT